MASAVAKRYADALSELLAKPDSGLSLDETLQQLESFDEVWSESPTLVRVLSSPAIAHRDKVDLLKRLAERLGLHRLVRHLLFVASSHRRLALTPQIVEALREKRDQQLEVERMEIVSAAPLEPDQRERLEKQFAELAGRRVEARYEVNPELLGGALVRLGPRVYDGTLRGRLRRLDAAMTGRA